MTESAQNADFRRKPQIFAGSPLLLEIPAFGGRREPQKTADFPRKPKNFAESRRKPQIGLRHLRSVTFGSAPKMAFSGFPASGLCRGWGGGGCKCRPASVHRVLLCSLRRSRLRSSSRKPGSESLGTKPPAPAQRSLSLLGHGHLLNCLGAPLTWGRPHEERVKQTTGNFF